MYRAVFGLIVCTLLTTTANAEKPVEGAASTETFRNIWSAAELVGDTDSGDLPFIKLRGRYHGQTFWVDGDGDSDHDWENRRIRLGLDMQITDRLEFGFDFNMARDSDDDFIENFDFISMTYTVSDDTAVSFGKLRRNPLTFEDGTSSNSIITVERSLLSSRFFMDNVGGVYVDHQRGDWEVGAGVLSGSTEADMRLPSLDGSTMFQMNIGRPISPITEVRFDYLYNPGDPDNNDVEPYRHIMSLNSSTRSGRWGLITDIIYARALPDARGDLFGIVLMPHYMLTDRLQFVGRYTWSGSNESDGIRLLNRYERRSVPAGFEFGDRHNAFYAGLNYYFYGHKLKLLSGIEYTDFDSVSGNTSIWTGKAALRFYF